MEDIEYKVDIDLDTATANFRIDLEGKKTKESYKGVFKVRCLLNPMAFISADKLYRDLIGKPSEAHVHASSLAFALSQLKYRVIKEPPFWTNREIPGGHIDDENIILEVLNRAIFCEKKFLEMKQEEAERIEKELTEDILSGLIEKEPELDSVGDDDENEDEVEVDL